MSRTDPGGVPPPSAGGAVGASPLTAAGLLAGVASRPAALLRLGALLAGAAAALPAAAGDGPSLSARLWAAPEGTALRDGSPYAGAVDLARLGATAARSEAVLRMQARRLTVEASLRAITDRDGDTDARLVATELFHELDAGGLHLTLGKKVTSWDVAFGFRPLDVVQQERRLAFRPFALEGVPQLAGEWLDERWDVTVLWQNPLQGRRAVPVHDEAAAARVYGRLGPTDLHLVARWSERTGAQAGAGLAWVAADALELHASALWQERRALVPGPHRGPGGSPLAQVPPGAGPVRRDTVAGVVGLTLTPGLGLSFLGEAWIDPGGDTASTWRDRRRLAEEQRAVGEAGMAPAAAVAGNLAWGLSAFDRPSLLRENVLLRASATEGRWEPAVDWLVTPADRGWVLTGACGWQGERLRFEGGLRIMGGPPGAAYRLYPAWSAYYAAVQLSL
jgi:hypothetical protein